MDKHDLISHEFLKMRFFYDPETGRFARWRQDGRIAKGKVGATHRLGYLVIGIGHKLYYAHRMAWFYVHGEWPNGELDHINGDKADNRIVNLRLTDRTTNMQNIRKKRSIAKATSKFLGVSKDPRARSRPWRATVYKGGKNHDCGYWATEEEAHAAYVAKKRELHEGCTL